MDDVGFWVVRLEGRSSRTEGPSSSLYPRLSVCYGVPDRAVLLPPSLSHSNVLIWEGSMHEGWGGAEYIPEWFSACNVG